MSTAAACKQQLQSAHGGLSGSCDFAVGDPLFVCSFALHCTGHCAQSLLLSGAGRMLVSGCCCGYCLQHCLCSGYVVRVLAAGGCTAGADRTALEGVCTMGAQRPSLRSAYSSSNSWNLANTGSWVAAVSAGSTLVAVGGYRDSSWSTGGGRLSRGAAGCLCQWFGSALVVHYTASCSVQQSM